MIKTIVVKVYFLNENAREEAAESCFIPVNDISKVKASNLTDACQRAAAHCIDELEKHLDK